MNHLNKISLRMRVTLLTGSILILCSIILTLCASRNAAIQFKELTVITEPYVIHSLTPAMVNQDTITSLGSSSPEAPFSPVTAAKKQFDLSSIIILTIVCLFGMGIVYTVAGRSLRPINQLSQTIASITESDLQYRISEDRNDEIGVLAHSFNTMLNRLEASFLRQKLFSANAAHELKTPLATINAGIQVLALEENPSIADCRATLAITERNVKRLIAIVDDLMQLGTEQEMAESEPIVLQAVLSSLVDELKPFLEEKHITVKIDCNLQIICGNPSLLYRAFFNLIENAIKYNKYGGEIVIEAISKDGLGKISIADTGDGIPPDEMADIFEPFYRVNKSRSRKTGGAGLGLSIVKMIAEKHGWQITVDSILNIGSVFTITFPQD